MQVKPANVFLVSPFIEWPQAKLADFGLGRHCSGRHTPNVGTVGCARTLGLKAP